MLKMDSLIKYKLFGLVVLLTFILSACGTPESSSSTSAPVIRYSLSDIVELGKVPADRRGFQGIAKEVFSYYTNEATPEVIVRYVKKDGGGDGSSWTNATNDVKTTIAGISDASDSRIYLILVASGDYPSERIAMTNNVAIIGGWEGADGWKRSGKTLFNGQAKNNVFYNRDIDGTAVLYGATVTNGKIDQGSSFNGAGMYNLGASPTLIKVVFSGNHAAGDIDGSAGGGMYNTIGSSPTLVDVAFLNNTAKSAGGGMFNSGSSPKLFNVVFSGNEAINNQGGGMYSDRSRPELYNVSFLNNTAGSDGGGIATSGILLILENVTFSGNQTTGRGGGIYTSATTLEAINVSFFSNTAQNGGGAYVPNDSYLYNASFLSNTAQQKGGGVYYLGERDENYFNLIINSLFWGNQAKDQPNQIHYYNKGTGTAYTNKLMLFSSIVEGGTNSGGGIVINIAEGASPIDYITANSIGDNPLLEALSDNGGFFHTPALKPNSPAIDKGVFLKRKGLVHPTVYSSEDRRNWYVAFDYEYKLSGEATPPNDAEDLATTDARGYKRKGRPDIGPFEYNGTP